MILGRLDTSSNPRVILDDKRTLDVDYDVLDRCGLSHHDRVRVSLAGNSVDALLPLLTTAEAIAILAQVLPANASSTDDGPWPRALLDIVFDHDTDATFSHDHHYLEPAQLARWAQRSGIPADDLDPEDTQLYLAINAKLAALDSPYRWLSLTSDDPRSAYLRLDRALADKLGIGIFDR